MSAPSESPSWPPIGSTATVTWATGSATMEVQRAGQDVLIATRAGGAPLPVVGTAMQLEWSDAAGLHQRGVGLEAIRQDVVQLYADGTAVRTQRRQFYRAQTALAAVVRNPDGELDGFTLDLSESGVRLRVDGPPPTHSAAITTDLVLEGNRMSLPGTVVRHDPTPHGAEIGVAFDDLPAPTADLIRRQVFNAQLSARREREGS